MSRPDRPIERVLVVGGGISGLTAALACSEAGIGDVTVVDADVRFGGKISTSPFAGLPAVDEGPDAFLTRVPDAVSLATDLGLGSDLVHPTAATAAVWHPGGRGGPLHPVPGGTVLGVPADLAPFARTGLLSWRGKARAALDVVLPRTSVDDDELGSYVRARVGSEVHERLVDALVGSIYAADTDRTSLRSIPQLAGLAATERSLLVGARRARRRMAAAPSGPIFAAPAGGVGALVDALTDRLRDRGVGAHRSHRVVTVAPAADRWRVEIETADGASPDPGTVGEFDLVVFATPAAVTAPVLRGAAPEAAELLARSEHADVIMVTLAIPGSAWPDRLRGRSGYLVPKPVQRHVTAASFASQKWAHWRPADGSEILRVSLGRDGAGVDHLGDGDAIRIVVDELGMHLGVDVAPTAARVTRWPAAFPQYRPHHDRWVRDVEHALPAGLVVTGASYHGIGIPACIRSARARVSELIG